MRKILVILFSVLATAVNLGAAPKQQDKGAFLFDEKAPQTGLNLLYGKQQLYEKFHKNAIKYFTDYLNDDAKTMAERAEGTALLAKAYLMDKNPAKSLETINSFLGTYGIPKDETQRNSIYLTAGQANISLGDYTTALNFLMPLLKMPPEELGALRVQTLTAAADAWNAIGQWDDTIQNLTPAIDKNQNLIPKERAALTWRILQAAIAQHKWILARNTIAAFEVEKLEESEKTTLKLLQISCDIGEGKTEEALKLYQENGLSNLIPKKENNIAPTQEDNSTTAKKDKNGPTQAEKQWWEVLSTLAAACQAKGLHKEAAEIFASARKVAYTNEDLVAAAKNQAEALVAINALPEAKNVLIEMHEKFPEDVAITIRLAELRQALNERRGASELFLSVASNETLEKSLRYKNAVNAASCLAQEGMADDAERVFRMAEKLTTSPVDQTMVLRYAAEQDEKLQRIDEAIVLYQEVADRFGSVVPQALEARMEAGRLLATQGKNSEAIHQFQQFLDACPSDSPLRWNALIAIGKATDDSQLAVEKLLSVARECPDAQLSSSSFLEAHSRALAIEGEGLQMALDILNEFLEKHPDENPDRIRQVRLKNIILGFQLGKPETLAWANTFISDYPNSTEAPEVALRVGDWYACQDDFPNAIKSYRNIADFSNAKPELKVIALYEEADCSSKCPEVSVPETITAEDGTQTTMEKIIPGQERAIALLDEISRRTTIPDILARVEFLRGDILTKQNKEKEALKAYGKARESAVNNMLMGDAILGRMAEIYFALGNTKDAMACVDEIRRNKAAGDATLNARALLIRARCLRKEADNSNNKNLLQEAINTYHQIRTEYETTRRLFPQETPSPYVYVNAVKELLEILDEKVDKKDANIVRNNYKRINKDGALPELPNKNSTSHKQP